MHQTLMRLSKRCIFRITVWSDLNSIVGKRRTPTLLIFAKEPATNRCAQWASIDIQKDSADKVHLAVRINRFDVDDGLIADFESLWVITLKNNKWAAQFRSSFAAL
jgi:hypothetical protein